jgi:hypothetical protein
MVVHLQTTRDQVSAALTPLAPEDRLALLRQLLNGAPRDVLWPVFHEWFPRLDNMSRVRCKLLRILRGAGDARPYLSDADADVLNTFQAEVWVVRGAPSSQKRGHEWQLTFESADAAARQCRAACGSGNVYEGMIARRHIFTVVSDDDGHQSVVIDYEKLLDFRLLDPSARRTQTDFMPYQRTPAAEIRAAELQPRHTEGGGAWDTYKWLAPPREALARLTTDALETALEDARTRLAAAHIDREILGREREVRQCSSEIAWRRDHPGTDPTARWKLRGKLKPKGKSPGRPKKVQPEAQKL